GNHRRSNTASRRSSAFSSNVAGIWRQRDLLSSRTNDDDDATLVDVRTSTSDDASSDDFRRALVVGATLPRVSCSRRYFQNFSVAGFVPSSAAKASALRSFSRHRSIRFRHSSRPVRVLRSSINRSLRDQPAYVCDARDRTDTLYATPISANGRKVLAAARHLRVPVHVSLVNVYKGDGQIASYRAINPSGRIPTLVDGDFVLWESNAILVYLSECCGDFDLSSRNHQRRADILRWMFWESSHWQPALSRFLAPTVRQILF